MDIDHRRLLADYGVWPSEMADDTPEGRAALAERVARICGRMRESGLAGDYAYSLPDHRSMVRLLKALQRN